MLPRPASGLRALLALIALTGAACAPRGELWVPPASEAQPPGEVVGTDTEARRNVRAAPREILVDARLARTSLGHFHRGDRLRLRVREGQWTSTRGAEHVGPAGLQVPCVAPAPHVCAAGNGVAPSMSLLLFSRPDPTPPACAAAHRFYIPSGVEETLPEDSFLFLAPNDWEDGVANNAGAIDVAVEAAAGPATPVLFRKKLSVQATVARTMLGRFAAGTRVSVSVLGGRWIHDPGFTRVGPEGIPQSPCTGGGAHVCAAGEGRAPIMGLVLIMAPCEDGGAARQPLETTTVIGAGAEISVAQDGELFLGPNDWEDGTSDNDGAMKVELSVTLALTVAR